MKDRVTYNIQYYNSLIDDWSNVVGYMWTDCADTDIDKHLSRMRESYPNLKYRILKTTETYEALDL